MATGTGMGTRINAPTLTAETPEAYEQFRYEFGIYLTLADSNLAAIMDGPADIDPKTGKPTPADTQADLKVFAILSSVLAGRQSRLQDLLRDIPPPRTGTGRQALASSTGRQVFSQNRIRDNATPL